MRFRRLRSEVQAEGARSYITATARTNQGYDTFQRRNLGFFIFLRVSVPLSANVSIPSRTPARLAFGGSGHADTIYSYPTSTTCCTDLRGHAVRLI